jgi:hypothetical protein
MDPPDTGRDTERDEELDLSPAPRSRAKLAILIIAAALLGAGAVARFAAGHHQSAHELANSVNSRTESSAIADMPAERLGELVALHSNPAVCPPTIECTRSASLPAASVRAVHRYIPRVVVQDTIAVTQTNPPRVYYRQLDATNTDGDLLLSLQVTRSDILDGLGSTNYSRSAANLTW